MAYAHNFLKVTFGGSIYDEDIWVNGINFGMADGDVGFESGNFSDALDAVAGHVETWFKNPASTISPSASLKWVKLAYINVDGKYFRDADIHDFETPVRGAASTNTGNPAPQLTLVQTFTTDVRRGPGRFGRIYPPLNTYPVQTDGRVNETYINGQASATAQLLANIGGELNNVQEGIHAIVASAVGTGVHARIKGVTVGDVVDTQRTRRNAFKEKYSVTAIVAGP